MKTNKLGFQVVVKTKYARIEKTGFESREAAKQYVDSILDSRQVEAYSITDLDAQARQVCPVVSKAH